MCVVNPISEQYRKEAKAEKLTFSMVLQNPDAYVGHTVLWGGIIIQTTAIQTGTEIIALETPLDRGEMPENEMRSSGRYIVMSSKFLDPTISGRE